MPEINHLPSHRKFCVSAAGFLPHSPLCDAILLPSFSTRTLHILGKTDVIVVEERTKPLLEISTNKRVEYHDGGTYLWHGSYTCG